MYTQHKMEFIEIRYRFHSPREIERESKSAVVSRNHNYCQLHREEGKKKHTSGHGPISNCPISRLRAPIRPEKDFLNFLNEQPRSSTSIRPNTFASNRTMPRSQQLTSIFHQSHAVHDRTRTFFSCSLCSFSVLSFFLHLQKKIMSNFFSAASHSSFRNFASVSLALVSAIKKNEQFDLFSQ